MIFNIMIYFVCVSTVFRVITKMYVVSGIVQKVSYPLGSGSGILTPIVLETQQFVFPTRCDTNRPVQSQKQTRRLGFRKKRDCTMYVVNTKTLSSCAVTPQLICIFAFAYANSWFSDAAAQLWQFLSFVFVFLYTQRG